VPSVTFITGNQHKADWMAKHLGHPVDHLKLDLDEIQSLDLREIVEHKVRQAYSRIESPVLVEDVSLTYEALGNLPGPLIKWFLQELEAEGLCRLLDGYASRRAIADITFAYFDGDKVTFFEGRVAGRIAKEPRGDDFGWNPIFIPEGSNKTYAEMNETEQVQFGLRTTTVFPQIKKFLNSL
jgi:non-canonical purine NTP pyrophosphatase (RdgB/HAM1 family)